MRSIPATKPLGRPRPRVVVDAPARLGAQVAALGVTVLTRFVQIGIQRWQSGLISAVQAGSPPSQETLEFSDRVVQLGALTQLVVLLITGIVFLRWLHGATRCTRALGGDTLRWTPKEAVTGFIIPFLIEFGISIMVKVANWNQFNLAINSLLAKLSSP